MNHLITPSRGVLHPNVLAQPRGSWKRKVVWDLHGVLADWMTPFYNFVSTVRGRQIKPMDVRLYYAGYQGGLRLIPNEFDADFLSFAQSQPGYGGLPEYEGAVEAMIELDKAGMGVEQAVWTFTPGASDFSYHHAQAFGTCPAQGETLAMLDRWVREKGMPLDTTYNLEFMPGSHKARRMADDWIPILVEDHGPTALSAAEDFGLAVILITQPFNVGIEHPNIIRWGDPAHPEIQTRRGLGQVLIRCFQQMAEAGVLEGPEVDE